MLSNLLFCKSSIFQYNSCFYLSNVFPPFLISIIVIFPDKFNVSLNFSQPFLFFRHFLSNRLPTAILSGLPAFRLFLRLGKPIKAAIRQPLFSIIWIDLSQADIHNRYPKVLCWSLLSPHTDSCTVPRNCHNSPSAVYWCSLTVSPDHSAAFLFLLTYVTTTKKQCSFPNS